MISDRSIALLIVSGVTIVVLAIFAVGFSVAYAKVWPYEPITILYKHTLRYIETGRWSPWGLYPRAPRNASRERWQVYRPERLVPGHRAIMGWDDGYDGYLVWLMDPDGQVTHTWPIVYEAPDAEAEPLHVNPHGMAVVPDGSLVVNFEHGGEKIMKLDACGRTLWEREGFYHHSVELTDDGALWTWRGHDGVESQRQYLAKLDLETGETLKELSVHEDMRNASPTNAAILSIPAGFRFAAFDRRQHSRSRDIFHPNDVEALPASLATQYPRFKPGDLLISLRNLDLVGVVDPDTGVFKWWRRGPWREQHDPDFGADGYVRVYNNNPHRGRSDIIAVKPGNRGFTVDYASGPIRFYTRNRGKMTVLPDNSIQITVPGEGRVIEVSEDSRMLMEFNNVVDEQRNAHVINATWLPEDYFSQAPSCEGLAGR